MAVGPRVPNRCEEDVLLRAVRATETRPSVQASKTELPLGAVWL